MKYMKYLNTHNTQNTTCSSRSSKKSGGGVRGRVSSTEGSPAVPVYKKHLHNFIGSHAPLQQILKDHLLRKDFSKDSNLDSNLDSKDSKNDSKDSSLDSKDSSLKKRKRKRKKTKRSSENVDSNTLTDMSSSSSSHLIENLHQPIFFHSIVKNFMELTEEMTIIKNNESKAPMYTLEKTHSDSVQNQSLLIPKFHTIISNNSDTDDSEDDMDGK